MPESTVIDDQPISATFFKEGKWLTSFITPNALEVQNLHEELTRGLSEARDRAIACWAWVASEVRYRKFIRGKIWIEGNTSIQDDLWSSPSITRRIKVGNCANKSFLLTSLILNDLPAQDVHCVLGNLYNGKPGGHAWPQVRIGGVDYIMESTRPDAPPLVPVSAVERYEAVHLFNDESVYSIEGRTVMEPFTACFSRWLSDYLDWAYIEGRK